MSLVFTEGQGLSDAEHHVAEALVEVLLQEVGGPEALDDDGVKIIRAYCEQVVAVGLIFARKQHDYGPGNIAKCGATGVLVRMSDKVERLLNLKGREGKNESKIDSADDFANYGLILGMVLRGRWPDVRPGWEL